MRRTVWLCVFVVGFCLMSAAQELEPWWLGMEMGEGQLKISSDQQKGTFGPTFALGFVGGHRVGQHMRVGMQVNGWLLQPFDLYDPMKGEAVSNVLGIVDVFPERKKRLFLRVGGGLAMYENNKVDGLGGHGAAWTAGAGYEIPVAGTFHLVPTVMYAGGRLGDSSGITPAWTGRRYSVVEFKVGMVWRF